MTDHQIADRRLAPQLTVEVRKAGRRAWVAPAGELDVATADRVAEEIRDLWRQGFGEVVLDLERVGFMDSSGVRMLVVLEQEARARTLDLALGGLSPAVGRVLEICGLGDYFRRAFPA